MLVVGLTGSLATGKSTVAGMFEQLGAKVLDADRLAHRLLFRNGACFKDVVSAFGNEILVGASISRRRLAKIVFADPQKLKQLEAIVHPKLRQYIVDKLNEFRRRSQYKVVILDVPLLFEKKFDQLVDCTIVVQAQKQVQLKRAMHRLKITEQEALKRIEAQMPQSEKIRLADFHIDNSQTKLVTQKQVKETWQKLLKKRAS